MGRRVSSDTSTSAALRAPSIERRVDVVMQRFDDECEDLTLSDRVVFIQALRDAVNDAMDLELENLLVKAGG